MSIGAELEQYVLQTHKSKTNSEDSVGVEPPYPFRIRQWVLLHIMCSLSCC